MRTHLVHGLAAMAAVALAACSNTYPQQPKDPINADPQPQQAITHHGPQEPGPSPGSHTAQQPFNDPSVQQPSFNPPTSNEAISQHDSTKPFYGPGLKSPEEQDAAREKAKAPLASDAEVLSVALAVNDGEVQMAEMAKKSADNAEVKSFAQMMSTHHTAGMQKVRTLQSKTKIELKENDLTMKVKNDAGQAMAQLRDKKGKEFDRLYMDTQVRMHKEALDAFDNRMIPAISNGEVKTGLTEMRKQVADHLAKAEQIQKKIDPSLAEVRSEDKSTPAAKAKKDTKDTGKAVKDEAKEKKNEVKEDVKH